MLRFPICALVLALPLAAAEDAHEPDRMDEVFMDVSGTAGPGEGYARPRLDVRCEDDSLVVSSNAIPHYEFVPMTPNPLVPLDREYRIPLRPALAEEPSPLPLFGPVGVAINGIPIFGPNEGPTPPPGFGDPVYNAILDACKGHTAREYHYHALVQSCFETAAKKGDPSPILAFAADGFPVYGPFDCADSECSEIIELKSSWERLRTPERDAWDAYRFRPKDGPQSLDRCNGHRHTRDDQGGEYHYHATATWPYILGCFSGTAPAAVRDGPEGRISSGERRRPPQPQADPRPSPEQVKKAAAELGIDSEALADALGLRGGRVTPTNYVSAARALNLDYPTLSRALGVEPQMGGRGARRPGGPGRRRGPPNRRGPGPRQ